MTLYAWAKRRAFGTLPAAEPRFFDVAPDARVLAHCNWQPDRVSAPTLLALHGLEGSSEAHYMRGLAEKAFAAVSPVIELEDCMQSIERRENRIYEWNFCRNLQGRMRRKEKHFPGVFTLDGLWKVWSIRTFDDRYTAPHHGYNGANDYYRRASAMRVIDKVARPSLILSAADDPFVPPEIFDDPALRANKNITTVVTAGGGHCAFVEPANGYDGYFAEQVVVEFLKEHCS